MPQIKIVATLPYFLLLEDGDYPSQADSGSYLLTLQNASSGGADPAQNQRSQVSSVFDGSATSGDDVPLLKLQQVEGMLQQTNRLLRWYRACTGRAEVTELTRAQASPFRFQTVDGDEKALPVWIEPIVFEASPFPLGSGQTMQSVTQAVRSGLSSKNDPEVSSLFLLDAEQSLREGRFRETVLFCWSAIDSTFSQKYKILVHSTVEGKNEREALTNFRNASMRYRMSAGLYFCTGTSLYEQPDGLWANLSESYSKRNSIIHDGASAQEIDAELALSVARQVVSFLKTLSPKTQTKKTELLHDTDD